MDTEELAEVDRELRLLCDTHGLAWVVSEVDHLIQEGRQLVRHPESVTTNRGLSWATRASPGKYPGPADFIAVPFSPSERTLLLIDAMLTVFAQLPRIQARTLEILRQGWNGKVPVVEEVSLSDDADGQEMSISVNVATGYDAIVADLSALRGVVNE